MTKQPLSSQRVKRQSRSTLRRAARGQRKRLTSEQEEIRRRISRRRQPARYEILNRALRTARKHRLRYPASPPHSRWRRGLTTLARESPSRLLGRERNGYRRQRASPRRQPATLRPKHHRAAYPGLKFRPSSRGATLSLPRVISLRRGSSTNAPLKPGTAKIGRASCRERGEMTVGVVGVKM